MADSKITALTALTAADPANDMIPIVDVSDTPPASGNTKRISINNLLACSPSATLASATISGDLTVATSALKVVSASSRVLINQASAIQGDSLEVSAKSDGGTISLFGRASDNGATLAFRANGVTTAKASLTANDSGLSIRTGTVERYQIDTTGVSTWSVAGTTAMTLNSTGLGVGGSPNTGLLTVGATTNASATANALTILSQRATFVVTANGATDAAGTTINYAWVNGGQGPLIFRNAAISNVLTLDSSGNVGIGVTPSVISGATRVEVKGSNSAGYLLRSGSANASARDWLIGANITAFGDFVIRQGNSQGAEPNSGTDRFYIDPSGNTIFTITSTPPTLSANSQLTVNATSNTNLRFSYRGSDGVTRVANLTLA